MITCNPQPVLEMIQRRSWSVAGYNPTAGLVLPTELTKPTLSTYIKHLQSYGFRIVLRDIIRLQSGFGTADLTRYVDNTTARRYLDRLSAYGIISPTGNSHYALVPQGVTSFGETFEWFIARLFCDEFRATALWGVRVRQAGCPGDLDVLGLLENNVVLVETKSAPPRNIELNNIVAFLDRIAAIRPHLALFVEDTNLRMADKIVVLFQDAFLKRARRDGQSQPPQPSITRLQGELFFIEPALYIINSKPSLLANMRTCIQHFLLRGGMVV